jgi:hypothetical protein
MLLLLLQLHTAAAPALICLMLQGAALTSAKINSAPLSVYVAVNIPGLLTCYVSTCSATANACCCGWHQCCSWAFSFPAASTSSPAAVVPAASPPVPAAASVAGTFLMQQTKRTKVFSALPAENLPSPAAAAAAASYICFCVSNATAKRCSSSFAPCTVPPLTCSTVCMVNHS